MAPPPLTTQSGIDYRGILNPSAKQRGGVSQVLAHLAGRTFWHKLFDNTPLLAQALGEAGSVSALLAFLADCDKYNISVDWRMPLVFLQWLGGQQTKYVEDDNAYVLECMGAAAAAWAGEVTDVGMYRMTLVCDHSKLAVGAIRPLTIDSGARVFGLQLDTQSPLNCRFRYAVSNQPEQWAADNWRAIQTFPLAESHSNECASGSIA